MAYRILNNILITTILLLGLSSCSGEKAPIKKDKMVNILVDMHITQMTKVRDRNKVRSWESYPYYNWVCEKHSVSRAELDSALSYYSKHEKKYKAVYDKVVDELSRIDTEVNSGMYAAETSKEKINGFGVDTLLFAMDTIVSDSIIQEIWPFERSYNNNDTTTFRYSVKINVRKHQRYLFKCDYEVLASEAVVKAAFRGGVIFSDGTLNFKTQEFDKGEKGQISIILETSDTQKAVNLFFEFIDLSYRELKLKVNLNNIRLYKLYTEKIIKNDNIKEIVPITDKQ